MGAGSDVVKRYRRTRAEAAPRRPGAFAPKLRPALDGVARAVVAERPTTGRERDGCEELARSRIL